MGFPCGSAGRESACNAGDLGSVPGLGRFPGEGKGYPPQYSGLENSMTVLSMGLKSQTRLSDFHFTWQCNRNEVTVQGGVVGLFHVTSQGLGVVHHMTPLSPWVLSFSLWLKLSPRHIHVSAHRERKGRKSIWLDLLVGDGLGVAFHWPELSTPSREGGWGIYVASSWVARLFYHCKRRKQTVVGERQFPPRIYLL